MKLEMSRRKFLSNTLMLAAATLLPISSISAKDIATKQKGAKVGCGKITSINLQKYYKHDK
jgi:hypothetical protein